MAKKRFAYRHYGDVVSQVFSKHASQKANRKRYWRIVAVTFIIVAVSIVTINQLMVKKTHTQLNPFMFTTRHLT